MIAHAQNLWKKLSFVALAVVAALLAMGLPSAAKAEVCNLKVVTDGNPDYSDIGSMLYSITNNWKDDKDKAWAIFYWNHIARRQSAPMRLHGGELTDPIRQFNDYGYTMCSTIAGANCAIFGAMGWSVKFWDISLHTVPEIKYDGAYHMHDNSLTALYTTCDGKRLAGVAEIGAEGSCEKSGGKVEPGHIAKYHCLYSTSNNGFLTGADTERSMAEESKCFNPKGLKYRYYLNHWELGHRYILNLRDNEVYTRYYHRMDADSPNAVKQSDKHDYSGDPAYFVPNPGGKNAEPGVSKDPEGANPRYHLRGNGIRTFAPPLTADGLAASAVSAAGASAVAPAGIQPAKAGEPADVVFKVEGSNVITSLTIKGTFNRATQDDVNAISVSTTNGLHWKDVWKNAKTGETPAQVKLIEDVNGSYEVLVKVQLSAKASPANAQLKAVSFETVTMLNSKTQPRLMLGKNTVCVGAGDQTESIVLWPDLQAGHYKSYVVDEKNIKAEDPPKGWAGALHADKDGEEAYVVFKIDAPAAITQVTYGGRFYNRAPNAHIDLLHSFDGGKTWAASYSLTETRPVWDVIHFETIDKVPAGTRSVLFKYVMNAPKAGDVACSLYSVRMEACYKPADIAFKPIEVTFAWKEPQEELGKFVERSHTQVVDSLPATYEINVGGADHPVMESLRVNLKGAAGEVKAGYSDGKDGGGTKFQDRRVTYGRNLAEGKPYTCTVKSETEYGAGDPDGKKLTDGVVGADYAGGTNFKWAALYKPGAEPVITVDLGKRQKCGAFRIQVAGGPFWDALKGEVKDKIEVLTSNDNKQFTSQGFFNMNQRWKDFPANYMWPDDETCKGHNFELVPPNPVEAQYVQFKVKCARRTSVSEVQVLEFIKYEPFDLKIALPDGKDRSDVSKYNPKWEYTRPYKSGEAGASSDAGNQDTPKGGKSKSDKAKAGRTP
jgi:hypothetical protein